MHADYLIVAITVPGQPRPIICIPHGAGGLHRRDDFAAFSRRVEFANDTEAPLPLVYRGASDDRALIYLAWHARGCVACEIDLRGCSVEPATLVQRQTFLVRSQLHRQSEDGGRSAAGGLLSLDDALELLSRSAAPVAPAGSGSLDDVTRAAHVFLADERVVGEPEVEAVQHAVVVRLPASADDGVLARMKARLRDVVPLGGEIRVQRWRTAEEIAESVIRDCRHQDEAIGPVQNERAVEQIEGWLRAASSAGDTAVIAAIHLLGGRKRAAEIYAQPGQPGGPRNKAEEARLLAAVGMQA